MLLDNPLEYDEVPKAMYYPIEDGRWLAVIYRKNKLGEEMVVTTGVEKSRKMIKNWIKTYMSNKCWIYNNEKELAPDMRDIMQK